MTEKGNNIQSGLSQEDLFRLLRDEVSSDELLELEKGISNCDLSRPALELVDAQQIDAIARISAHVNGIYPSGNITSWYKKIFGWSVLCLGLVIGGALLMRSPEKSELAVEKEQSSIYLDNHEAKVDESEEETFKTTESQEDNIEAQEKSIQIQKTSDKKNNVLNPDIVDNDSLIQVSQPKSTPALVKPIEKVDNLKKSDVANKTDVVLVPEKKNREIKAVNITTNIPEKYKDRNYSTTSLVSYALGRPALEQEIFNKLKDQISIKDLPKNSRSVVFKFTVTSKGNVKDVDVQSVVSPQLEAIIEKTILELDQWENGSKNIPVDYTVFITFK